MFSPALSMEAAVDPVENGLLRGVKAERFRMVHAASFAVCRFQLQGRSSLNEKCRQRVESSHIRSRVPREAEAAARAIVGFARANPTHEAGPPTPHRHREPRRG